jgi:hypothetical protein
VFGCFFNKIPKYVIFSLLSSSSFSRAILTVPGISILVASA